MSAEGGELQPQGETPDGNGAPDGSGVPDGAPDGAMPQDGQAPEPPEGLDGQMPDGTMPDLPEGEVPTMPEDGQMPEPPEGFDGQMPERPEGAEGGQMPQGGRGDMADMGGAGGPLGANASEDCLIQVNGGAVTIQAGGDAVDSNGYIEVTGGTLLGVSSGNGDSALDYEYGATITGGTVLLAGSAGMAESFTEGTQPFALVMAQGAAGAEVAVADAAGTTLVDYTASSAFQCVVVSAPQLAEGDAGTVSVNGTATEFTASTTSAMAVRAAASAVAAAAQTPRVPSKARARRASVLRVREKAPPRDRVRRREAPRAKWSPSAVSPHGRRPGCFLASFERFWNRKRRFDAR